VSISAMQGVATVAVQYGELSERKI
jgi:hypothetical protein